MVLEHAGAHRGIVGQSDVEASSHCTCPTYPSSLLSSTSSNHPFQIVLPSKNRAPTNHCLSSANATTGPEDLVLCTPSRLVLRFQRALTAAGRKTRRSRVRRGSQSLDRVSRHTVSLRRPGSKSVFRIGGTTQASGDSRGVVCDLIVSVRPSCLIVPLQPASRGGGGVATWFYWPNNAYDKHPLPGGQPGCLSPRVL